MKNCLPRLVLVLLPAVLLLAAHGQTKWTALGPDAIPWYGTEKLPAAGKIGALVVNNANPAVMYAAGGGAGPNSETGVYKTVNQGVTWVHADVGLTDPIVNALWLDQANPKILLAGTSMTGIFRSTDAGAQWQVVAPFGNTPALLQVGSTLYAATLQGVATSTDDGATWNVVEPPPTNAAVSSLAAAGGLIYAGVNNGQVLVYSSGIWVPTSPVGLWAANAVSIAVNPSNPQNAFVVEWSGYSNPSLYETQNAGGLWSQVITTTNCPGPFLSPAQVVAWDSDTNVIYAGCDFQMSQSTDGGNTWIQIPSLNSGQFGAWDVRLIVTDFSGKSGYIAVGSDQGLFLTKNAGSTWQSLNGKIKTSIVTGLAVHGSTILAATQDFLSGISSFDGGKTWSQGDLGGEGGLVFFNPGKPSYAYAFNPGGFFYSTDGGNTFTQVTTVPNAIGGGDVAVDTKNPSTVYVASTTQGGIFISTNWGVSFNPTPSNWPSSPTMIAVDPTNSNKIFVGQQNGSIMVSSNGGALWTSSSVNCTNCGWPVTAAIYSGNPKNVMVGMNGGIVVSLDGGTAFNQSPGIVPGPYSCVAPGVARLRFDPSGSGLLAAATNIGLYTSTNFGTNWSNIDGNAVPRCFNDVVFANKKLYVSAGGEGILSTPFPN